MRGENCVLVSGVTTAVVTGEGSSVDGVRYSPKVMALFSISRRLKFRLKEAFLLSGPLTLALIWRFEKLGLLLSKGLRELNTELLSLKFTCPRILSVPGFVRISMRPKPNWSYSAENGLEL